MLEEHLKMDNKDITRDCIYEVEASLQKVLPQILFLLVFFVFVPSNEKKFKV